MIPHKIFITFFVLCSLCSGQAMSQSVILQRGDSVVIMVKANKRLNRSGIRITKGETYMISATGKWQDAGFEPTDAGGFPPKNKAMRFARFLKPVPKENY